MRSGIITFLLKDKKRGIAGAELARIIINCDLSHCGQSHGGRRRDSSASDFSFSGHGIGQESYLYTVPDM